MLNAVTVGVISLSTAHMNIKTHTQVANKYETSISFISYEMTTMPPDKNTYF